MPSFRKNEENDLRFQAMEVEAIEADILKQNLEKEMDAKLSEIPFRMREQSKKTVR